MRIPSLDPSARIISAAAIGAFACLVFSMSVAAAPTIWSGHTYEFIREDFSFPSPQDSISPNVSLARGEMQGLFNAVLDSGWNGSGPSGTEWATSINNPDITIAATNWADLQFGTWLAAYGGSGALGHEITDKDAIVHLIDDDIYLDLRFTSWTQRSGGGFSYLRAEPPAVPEPTLMKMIFFGIPGIIFALGAYDAPADSHLIRRGCDRFSWCPFWDQSISAPSRGCLIMRNSRAHRVFCSVIHAFVVIAISLANRPAMGQTFWSELTQAFTKASYADHTLPENQDHLTSSVMFTRGDIGGLINFANELDKLGYTHFNSPRGTEWATDLTTSVTVAATNWQQLEAADAFTSWIDAYGGQSSSGSQIVGRNAVVHLISENIYLDLQFTEWINMRGGGFTYLRAAPPTPTGDYNGDLVVNAADYTVWRNTLGQSVAFHGAGADGDGDGMVDFGDYFFWKDHYGDIIGGMGAGQSLVGNVPEPTALTLAAALILLISCASRPLRGGHQSG